MASFAEAFIVDTRYRNLALGFLAAAIAVVTVHQALLLVSNLIGLENRPPWATDPVGPLGVPRIVNAMFWGGLWGALLALLFDRLPGGAAWLKGLVFGWGVFLISNCLLLPLIKGNPLFYDFDANKLISVFMLLSGFGAATAVIYSWLRRPA